MILKLLPQLKQRVVTQPNFAKVIYLSAGPDTRLEILKHIINGPSTQSIEFVNQLKLREYPRIEVARMFLDKVDTLSGVERTNIYDFIVNIIKDKDELALKDTVAEQIKSLLNQDNENNSNEGFNLFTKAEFLSEEKKRDIIKSTLEFLRQPSKQITGQHKYSLKAITVFFNNLQTTPQKDYIYFLFSLIKDGQNEEVLRMALENLSMINPSFTNRQKDYQDLLTTLGSWNTENTKTIVVESLLTLKPSTKKTAKEEDFWQQVESQLEKD